MYTSEVALVYLDAFIGRNQFIEVGQLVKPYYAFHLTGYKLVIMSGDCSEGPIIEV